MIVQFGTFDHAWRSNDGSFVSVLGEFEAPDQMLVLFSYYTHWML